MALICRFEIPYPEGKKAVAAWNKRFSLNAYYAGKNYHQRKRDADEMHSRTILAVRQRRIRRQYVTGPVAVKFYWPARLDIDNHAVMGKMVVDALKGYILPDDNPRWYRRVTHEYWPEMAIGVEVWDYEEEEK